jgi:hypothetical protein
MSGGKPSKKVCRFPVAIPGTEPSIQGTIPGTESSIQGTIQGTEPSIQGTIPGTESSIPGTIPATGTMSKFRHIKELLVL